MNAPKRRVLITGASGFIGKPMVRALAASGWAVRAASRDPAAIPDMAGVERVALPDLARAADWTPLVDGVDPCPASCRHRARAGPAARRGLYPHQHARRSASWRSAARGRVERLVLMSSVRAQAGLAAEHVITEDRPAAAHRRLRALQARGRAAAGARAASPSPCSAPPWSTDVASKAISRASPRSPRRRCRCPSAGSTIAARCSRSTTSPRRSSSRSTSPQGRRTRSSSSPTPSRSASLTSSPPCAKGLGRSPHLVARAGRRGEAADGDLRQGGGVGAAVGEFRDRRREAPRHRLATRASRPTTASPP